MNDAAAPHAQPTAELHGALVIREIVAHATHVLDAVRGVPHVVLDAAGVTDLDAAGLQLLMLVARDARAAGGGVRLQAPSRAVRDVLALARLGDDLLPIAPEAA